MAKQIDLKDVDIYYGDFLAVEGVTLTIPPLDGENIYSPHARHRVAPSCALRRRSMGASWFEFTPVRSARATAGEQGPRARSSDPPVYAGGRCRPGDGRSVVGVSGTSASAASRWRRRG